MEGGNIVPFEPFRKKCEDAKLPAIVNKPSATLHQEPAREYEKVITVDDALLVAHNVVEKYSDKQELFNTYLTEHEKEPSLRDIEMFNILLKQKKEIVADWNIGELMGLIQSYSENPQDTFKIHVFCAAEELLKRVTVKDE